MGSSSLLYFLVFLLLISESSQGIRLDEGLKPSLEKKSHGDESSLSRTSMDTGSEIILCNHGLCAGKHRNLVSFTTISTLVIPKKDQNESVTSKTTSEAAKCGGEAGSGKENVNVKGGSPKPPHMDVAGIAEMDYSPARRKTPIHN